MSIELEQFDALGLADLVTRKEVRPIELVEAAIERIERVNPELNCVMFKNYDAARAAAEQPLPDGPFAGVPLLLKDLLTAYRGLPLTGGCRYLQDFVAPDDSVIAQRIAEGGFIRLAKTVTPEMGYCVASEPPNLSSGPQPVEILTVRPAAPAGIRRRGGCPHPPPSDR